MTKIREQILYKEAYVRPGRKIGAAFLPTLSHTALAPGWQVTECYLREAGKVERDGAELEYHDLRVYFTERPDGAA